MGSAGAAWRNQGWLKFPPGALSEQSLPELGRAQGVQSVPAAQPLLHPTFSPSGTELGAPGPPKDLQSTGTALIPSHTTAVTAEQLEFSL